MLILKPQDPMIKTERYEMDPERGIINIGSADDNDIVVKDPSIQPFHMVLLCREKPYQIILVDPEAELTIRDVRIHTEDAITVANLSEVRFGSFGFTSTQGGASGSETFSIISAPIQKPTQTLVSQSLVSRMDSGQNISSAALMSATQPLTDISDEVIILELQEKDAAIQVDQTATYQFIIINGGPIVATFDVAVEGVPAEWVSIQPNRVNLFEGAKTLVTVSITPPRRPDSAAGQYLIKFLVTSPNHPGRQSYRQGTLTLAAYYDFGISDLAPARRVIPWRKKFSLVQMRIQNKGNSSTRLRLVAQDDGSECQFQFRGTNGLMQLGQVEYVLPAGEMQEVPLQVSPIKRSLFGFSSRQYPYRVSVAQQENEAPSLFSMGMINARPLIGLFELILILLLLAVTTVYLFTPDVTDFSADNSVIGVGESTTLHWKAFFLTHDVQISGLKVKAVSVQGSEVVFPTQTVNTYNLAATTWLWKMLNLEPVQKSFTILAVPGEPQVNTFMVSANEVLVGDTVILRWSVGNATKVVLTVNGVSDVFEDPKQFNGERNLFIETNTLISIEATNALGSVVKSTYVLAKPPSIVIDKFEVSKSAVYKNEQVTIRWKISGTGMEKGGEVMISAFPSALPLEGELTFFPEASMEFVLTVKNRQAKEVRILPVGVLDPAAPPVPPTINFFTAAPDTLIGPGNVELSWSVSGSFQNISINNNTAVIVKGLPGQGFKTVAVSNSGTYILTATNLDKSAGKELKITVNPSLLKASLAINSISRTTNLILSDTVTVSISAKSPAVTDPPPTGKVVISDGTNSCTIDLPNISCELTFKTSGTKLIYATYLGDSKYVQSKSDAFSPPVVVAGNDLTIDPVFKTAESKPLSSNHYFSEKIKLVVNIAGTNPLTNPDGIIRVWRLCDTSGNADYLAECTDKQIGYYKLLPDDGGVHEFSDILIDQKGGKYEVKIYYTDDTFYNEASIKSSINITNIWAGPVSIRVDGSDSIKWAINEPQNLILIVQDTNANGLVSVPLGNLKILATHSNGVDTVTCSNGVPRLVAANTGSSSGLCIITPTKTGVWTLSGVYTPVNDIWHAARTEPSIQTFNSNISPIITLLDSTTHQEVPVTTSPTLETFFNNTLVINIDPSDNNDNGTLGCSSVASQSGIGFCECTHSGEANSYWFCTVQPNIVSPLPAFRTINFNYTAAPNSNKESGILSRYFKIIKILTNTILDLSPNYSTYSAGSTVTVDLAIARNSGGDAPSVGKATLQVGPAGQCDPDNGIGNNALAVYTLDISKSTSVDVILDDSFTLKSAMVFCARYEGDGAYVASPWVSSNSFEIARIATKIALTSSTTLNSSYAVGNTAALNFTVSSDSGKPSDPNPATGTITILSGTGECNPTVGLTGTVIETVTTQIGTAKTITLASKYVVGADVHFCFQYAGTGDYSSSPWVSSDYFRVKAIPVFDTISNVVVINSQNQTVTSDIPVAIHSGYNMDFTKINLFDSSNNLVCITSSPFTVSIAATKCSYNNADWTPDQSGGTNTYSIAANAAASLTLTAKYIGDDNNMPVESQPFTLISKFKVIISNVSVSPNYLYAYTPLETAVNQIGITTLTGQINFENFSGAPTGYQFNQYLSASTVPLTANDDVKDFAAELSPDCTINKTTGSVECKNLGVIDSRVTKFKLTITPASNQAQYYTGTFTGTSGAVNVIQNIIEEPSDPAYALDIQPTDMECGGYMVGNDIIYNQKVYQVTGYTAGYAGTPENNFFISPFEPQPKGNFSFKMSCNKQGDGENNYLGVDVSTPTYYFLSDRVAPIWESSGPPYKFTFKFVAPPCPDGPDEEQVILDVRFRGNQDVDSFSYSKTIGYADGNPIPGKWACP
ncbi:MAG: FHA domain-containing protein [Chloroflexota bacterium]